jgi:hypothetical protein
MAGFGVKRIKINFAGGVRLGHDLHNYPYKPILESRYEVEISDRPDYVFVSQDPKSHRSLMAKFQSVPIRIFDAGETIVPDFNLCDYGIGWDPIDYGDRYYQINPLNFSEFGLRYASLSRDKSPSELLEEKDRFCNFIYSNPHAHPDRDNFFEMLGRYKKVDSAGKHLNNYGDEILGARNWTQTNLAFQRRYKFSIAFENAAHIGYTTEKLINPMLAGSIPIYWGNPEVGKAFNTRSLIYCGEMDNHEQVVERLKENDNDDSLYMQMAGEPWMTEEQVGLAARKRQEFEEFLFNIFDQPLERARRRGHGFWNDKYEERFRQRIVLERTVVGKGYAEWGKAKRRLKSR